jgi:hypothetical protein
MLKEINDDFSAVFGCARGTSEDVETFAVRQAACIDGQYLLQQIQEQWVEEPYLRLHDGRALMESALLFLAANRHSGATEQTLAFYVTDYFAITYNRIWGSRAWRASLELGVQDINLPPHVAHVHSQLLLTAHDLGDYDQAVRHTHRLHAQLVADWYADFILSTHERKWAGREGYAELCQKTRLTRRFRKDIAIMDILDKDIVVRHLLPWLLADAPRDKTCQMMQDIVLECAQARS